MDDISFDVTAWSTFCGSLSRLSPSLAPRLFRVALVEPGVRFTWWWPGPPESVSNHGFDGLDPVLPFLIDQAPPPGSPIASIEQLLQRAAEASQFRFVALRRAAALRAPARVATILRVRQQGLPEAFGSGDVAYLDQAPDGDPLTRRATLLNAVVLSGLELMDRERRLELAACPPEDPLTGSGCQITPIEHLRRSAAAALDSGLRRVGLDFTHGGFIFQRIEDLSKRAYERRDSRGVIRFSKGDPDVRFRTPVNLLPAQEGAARKVLEMSHAEKGRLVMSDGRRLLGLAERGQTATGEHVDVVFEGPQRWSCTLGERRLFTVTRGVPRSPTSVLPRHMFEAWASRTFPGQDARVELMWPVVEQALDAQHGAVLVFCSSVEECLRLPLRHAFEVAPGAITPGVLAGLVSVDGAVAFDLSGRCHAAGVILDGQSVEDPGDLCERRERGARYTSTVRFLANHRGKAGAVVVSEDGGVDLLPPLPALGDPYCTDRQFLDPHDNELGRALRHVMGG